MANIGTLKKGNLKISKLAGRTTGRPKPEPTAMYSQ
jgi:hypothetical protein